MYILLFLALQTINWGIHKPVHHPVPENIWLNDLDQALLQAQQNQKKVLLVFSGSDWCRPCIQLKDQILSQNSFEQFAQTHLVLVNVDFPRKKKNQLPEKQLIHNEQVAEKYNPQGYFPQILLLDEQGNIIQRLAPSYPNTENLIKDIQENM